MLTKPNSPRTSTEAPPATIAHVCLAPNCEAKHFRRKADLERHYQQKHTPSHLKKQYFCDYSKCPRREEPFHRVDHFRDHYRDYHCEDIPRKTGEKDEWYDGRAVSRHWWRCNKCLKRKSIVEVGWECPGCGSRCDSGRRKLRGYD